MFYETGPGDVWQRNTPITTPRTCLRASASGGGTTWPMGGQHAGCGRDEFLAEIRLPGAHENLHLVERWTRLDADTIEYAVTIDDPTTWIRSWTVKQELKKQSDAANRIYSEPRCHEGNYGLAALLRGARVAERAFAEGRGPDPATQCIVIECGGFAGGGFADEGDDANPLQ
jgi:hypothetical protein